MGGIIMGRKVRNINGEEVLEYQWEGS